MSVTFTNRFDDAMPAIRVGMMNGLTATALVMQRSLRKSLSQRGTGRRYRVARGRSGGRNLRARGWHQASSPGEPPAANTGALRRSWTIAPVKEFQSKQEPEGYQRMEQKGRSTIVYTFGSNLKYARALEYGVPSRRLAARFYVRPTIDGVTPEIPKIVARQIQLAISRVGRQIEGL